ncbi:MAG: hypothetical protein HKO62_06670 [Gammaproteobacteria bacterium]|nr:hypothetical protein [Gammaproteobacteria bacterium]NNM00416.1 hypothetical protein [Gammaproteobacteria bacterium]
MREFVLGAPPQHFWMLAAIMTLLGAAAFGAAFVAFYRKRVIEDTPTSRIRSAAQGYTELEGHAQLMEGHPIVSPLTGAPCTWYRCKVEERQSGGNGRDGWRKISGITSDELFLLIDETGRCIVDPEGAKVRPAQKHTWYGQTPTPQRGPGHNPGQGLGIRLGSSRRYRYTEELLLDGGPLYALGLFVTHGGAGSRTPADDEIRDLVRTWKQDSEALLNRFDTNKDGEIDVAEWQRVREAAAAEVAAKHAGDIPSIDMIGATRDTRRPFLLSATPQADLTRRYSTTLWASLSASLLVAVSVIWAITTRING